jgi:hypothetical protein
MTNLAAGRGRTPWRAASAAGVVGLVAIVLCSGLGPNGPTGANTAPCGSSSARSVNCANSSTTEGAGTVPPSNSPANASWNELSQWPSARSQASLIWDPSIHSALLFGGLGLNDTWAFNGSNWTQLSPASSPPAEVGGRAYTALVYDATSKSEILFGPDLSSETWVYSNGSWTEQYPGGGVPAAGSVITFAGDPHGGYIVGVGVSVCGRYACSKDWAYKSGSWSQLSSPTVPWVNSFSSMTYDENASQVLLVGASSTQSGTYNETWVFQAGNWTQLHPRVNPPGGGSLAFDSTTGQDVLYDAVTSYLFSNGNWTPIRHSPSPRGGAETRLINDPARGGVSVLATNGIWTYANGTWSLEYGNPNVPWSLSARSPADAAVGRILVYDSALHAPVTVGRIGYKFRNTEVWALINGSWRELSSGAPDRQGFGAGAYVPSTGCIVLFGGGGYRFQVSNQTWFFCNGKWSQQVWSNCSAFPQPMYGMSMAYDPALGRVVMFGGYGYLGPLTFTKGVINQTWELVNRCWVRVYNANPPSARQGVDLTYDSTDGYLVLFGGFRTAGAKASPVPMNDTWVFNGTRWTQVSVGAPSPSARLYSATSDDPSLGGVVLFGGLSSSGPALNDTWLFSAGTWTPLRPAGGVAPQVRYGESMVYLPGVREVFLAWGTTTDTTVTGRNAPFVGAPGPWLLA